ncbi:hypothetical protein VP01_1504g3 [Puccinia sorghi]|uniref:Tet-like 2OG-Fe(II) oxygenase domain-containing protein n=1 Tax=Puccinia sorghi TaxID=27349 RepID=A0A0L6VJ30_9BASI|nr:hypothetical protein VP01_1504g3 [Puccinia sorghi]
MAGVLITRRRTVLRWEVIAVRRKLGEAEGKTSNGQPEHLWILTYPLVAVVKFDPFQMMDTSFKSQYHLLSQHLMYSLGWQKGYEESSKIGITGIAAKFSKDPEADFELQTHVPEQNTFIGLPENPLTILTSLFLLILHLTP